jgi:TrmH family RNA methyltransferase
MDFRLKRYRKDSRYSYAFGVSSTLELLDARPARMLKVVLDSKGGQNAGIAALKEECGRRRIPLITDDKTLRRLSPKESHLAVGVFNKYQTRLDPNKDHVVLVNPSDMGNLGSIARTMVAFGMTDLALVRPAADIFDPRTVRASMGAIFRLSFEYFDSFDDYRSRFAHNLYPLMTDGRAPIDRVRFEPPVALIFGNEGGGLPDEFLDTGTSAAIRHEVTIDSLNLSAAVAIVLYERTRARP